MRIGVISVQGDFAQHIEAMEAAGRGLGLEVEVVRVRRPTPDIDLFVLPGGESTTIAAFLHRTGLDTQLAEHLAEGRPVMGTCAGAILLASEGDDQVRRTDTKLLGSMNTRIQRNAYGRQRESFEAPLRLKGEDDPYMGVFIRAPRFEAVGDAVEPVAWLGDEVVGVREGPAWAFTFHPELTPDPRLHAMVLRSVQE